MKRQTFIWLAVMVLASSTSFARVGGGRSFGSRGSRAFSPRPTPHSYQRPPSAPYQANRPPRPDLASPQMERPGFFSGGFGRALVGGLAGGFIGSMLFRGMGFAGNGGAWGGGGIGFLEILIIGALVFFVIRWMRSNRPTHAYAGHTQPSGFLNPNPPTAQVVDFAGSASSESEVEQELQRYNPDFSLEIFKEKRTDDFFRIQAAFMARDITQVRLLLTPEMHDAVEKDIAELHAAHKINRLESMAVRQTQLTEAWQEFGKEYATIHFTASLLDYTVDDRSGQILSGSNTTPIKFDESWTFVRDLNASKDEWRLCAIGNA